MGTIISSVFSWHASTLSHWDLKPSFALSRGTTHSSSPISPPFYLSCGTPSPIPSRHRPPFSFDAHHQLASTPPPDHNRSTLLSMLCNKFAKFSSKFVRKLLNYIIGKIDRNNSNYRGCHFQPQLNITLSPALGYIFRKWSQLICYSIGYFFKSNFLLPSFLSPPSSATMPPTLLHYLSLLCHHSTSTTTSHNHHHQRNQLNHQPKYPWNFPNTREILLNIQKYNPPGNHPILSLSQILYEVDFMGMASKMGSGNVDSGVRWLFR